MNILEIWVFKRAICSAPWEKGSDQKDSHHVSYLAMLVQLGRLINLKAMDEGESTCSDTQMTCGFSAQLCACACKKCVILVKVHNGEMT